MICSVIRDPSNNLTNSYSAPCHVTGGAMENNNEINLTFLFSSIDVMCIMYWQCIMKQSVAFFLALVPESNSVKCEIYFYTN